MQATHAFLQFVILVVINPTEDRHRSSVLFIDPFGFSLALELTFRYLSKLFNVPVTREIQAADLKFKPYLLAINFDEHVWKARLHFKDFVDSKRLVMSRNNNRQDLLFTNRFPLK